MMNVLCQLDEFPDYYVDFQTGHVWSLKSGRFRRLSGGMDRGYRIYSLCHDGKQTTRSGHRLVAEAAYGSKPIGTECCHGNSVRDDNRAENLRWATPSENNGHDKEVAGLLPFGSKHHNSRTTEDVVRRMRKERAIFGTLYADLGAKYGMSMNNAWRICTGRAWTRTK